MLCLNCNVVFPFLFILLFQQKAIFIVFPEFFNTSGVQKWRLPIVSINTVSASFLSTLFAVNFFFQIDIVQHQVYYEMYKFHFFVNHCVNQSKHVRKLTIGKSDNTLNRSLSIISWWLYEVTMFGIFSIRFFVYTRIVLIAHWVWAIKFIIIILINIIS